MTDPTLAYHLRVREPAQLRDAMVEEWTDERALGHGWFVLLRCGWSFDPLDDEAREQSYESKREARLALVYPTEETSTGGR